MVTCWLASNLDYFTYVETSLLILVSAIEDSLLCLTALTMRTQFQSKDYPFVSVLTTIKDYTHDLFHLQ